MNCLSVIPTPRTTRISILATLVCASLAAGCSDVGERVWAPTDRTPPTFPPGAPPLGSGGQLGMIAGFVVDESRHCIIGASVEIIDGPRAGTAFGQTVCVSWYDETPGYYFGDLPLALPVTLRATAVGYRASERVVAPTRDLSYTGDLVLTKSP